MKSRQFTLRKWTIAVALAALATRGFVLSLRSLEFAARANEHEGRWSVCRMHVFDMRYFKGQREILRPSRESFVAKIERREEFEGRMYRKYRRAALLPWLAVSPDEEPPELPNCPPLFPWQGISRRLPTPPRAWETLKGIVCPFLRIFAQTTDAMGVLIGQLPDRVA